MSTVAITSSLDVLVQLREPAYPPSLSRTLFQHSIAAELVLLHAICLKFQFADIRTPRRCAHWLRREASGWLDHAADGARVGGERDGRITRQDGARVVLREGIAAVGADMRRA